MSTASRLSLLVVLVLTIGCSSSDLSEDIPANPVQAAAEKANALNEATEQAAKPAEESQPEPVEEPDPLASYTPPFPERRDMFSPPKHVSRAPQRSSGEVADSVVLMGFAKLDEQSVVLAINGRVTPLSHGQESAGVRVISIDPPRAVLQRGRNRWTASIE